MKMLENLQDDFDFNYKTLKSQGGGSAVTGVIFDLLLMQGSTCVSIGINSSRGPDDYGQKVANLNGEVQFTVGITLDENPYHPRYPLQNCHRT